MELSLTEEILQRSNTKAANFENINNKLQDECNALKKALDAQKQTFNEQNGNLYWSCR